MYLKRIFQRYLSLWFFPSRFIFNYCCFILPIVSYRLVVVIILSNYFVLCHARPCCYSPWQTIEKRNWSQRCVEENQVRHTSFFSIRKYSRMSKSLITKLMAFSNSFVHYSINLYYLHIFPALISSLKDVTQVGS